LELTITTVCSSEQIRFRAGDSAFDSQCTRRRLLLPDRCVSNRLASGPQPQCDFIEVFGEAPIRHGSGEVAGAGEDGAIVSGSGGRSTGTASGVAGTLLTRSHAFQARSFIRLRSRLSSARHSCGGGHPLGHLSTLESTTDSVQPSDQSSNCVRLRMCRDHLAAFPVDPPSVNRR
jgi:hypothetical protein